MALSDFSIIFRNFAIKILLIINLTSSFHGRIYIIWTHKVGKFHEKEGQYIFRENLRYQWRCFVAEMYEESFARQDVAAGVVYLLHCTLQRIPKSATP